MFDYFPIFHEMDFSQIIDEFNRLYNSRSVLDLLMSRYKYSVGYVSNSIGLPYDTLYSYKQRRRDIKKINAEIAYRLSALFRVRIETLLEIKN